MAYQRPFLISMKKTDPHQPWGFRTFGGKDYGEPHSVERVLEDSNAERCGLHQGDEIIQIGRINVQDMTFGQVQEILARSGNKIEMFVIREDLLSPRKGKEPPFVKAVVHNPYNSPLNLYSTENIADTLAKQTEVLTEGHVSSAEEEEGPENLSFKQKSAVFQLLEEQARQDTVIQQKVFKSDHQKRPAPPPPPPPKPKPPASENYQNKENFSPQGNYQSTFQANKPAHSPQENYHTNLVEHRRVGDKVLHDLGQSQRNISAPVENYSTHDHYNSTHIGSTQKVGPPPPPRSVTSVSQEKMSTPYKQQQQQPYYNKQNSQSNEYQGATHQTQKQWQQQHEVQQRYQVTQQQQQQQQQHYQPSPQQYHQSPQQHQQPSQQYQQTSQQYQKPSQQYQQPSQQYQQPSQQYQHSSQQYQPSPQQQQQYYQKLQQQTKTQQPHPQPSYYQGKPQVSQPQQQPTESIFDEAPHPVGVPMIYKAPPSQKHKTNWPPQSPVQQNGRWNSPSPTPASPSRNIESVWPPKQPTAKDMPKSGFNPVVLREQGSGRRCVWPPPKPDDEFRSGRTTPQSPVSGRRIVFNPSPSPPTNRRAPFGSMSPVGRRKDIAWPPPQPVVGKTESHHQKSSPTCTRRARFDDYIRQHAGNNVPSTYRPPPGTQHVEYC